MISVAAFMLGVLAGAVGLTVIVFAVATRDVWGGEDDGEVQEGREAGHP